MARRVRVVPGQQFKFPSGSVLTRENELVLPDLEANDPVVLQAIADGILLDVGSILLEGGGGGPTGFSLQVILAGNLIVASNVVRPGLRVIQDSVATTFTVRLDTPSVGAPAVFEAERWQGGALKAVIGRVTVPAGAAEASLTGLAVACNKNDSIKFNIVGIGSTTPGADANLSLDFAPA